MINEWVEAFGSRLELMSKEYARMKAAIATTQPQAKTNEDILVFRPTQRQLTWLKKLGYGEDCVFISKKAISDEVWKAMKEHKK